MRKHESYSGAVPVALVTALIAAGLPVTAATTCNFGGQGDTCATTNECADNAMATVCVDGMCEIPCEIEDPDNSGAMIRKPSVCSIGESCVPGETLLGPVHYCQASKFSMDLNLLDQCILTFIERTQPDFGGAATCSLEWRLNQMLDQDDNNIFDIYDLDQCIIAFLEEPPCDADAGTCPDNQVYCDSDEACGKGLFCNQEMHRCERECGFISSRTQNEIDTLERQCTGFLSYCDYDTGRCRKIEESELGQRVCQVDEDCPNGAYCLMGQCAPKCFRNVDCPGSDWYCSRTNACVPIPKSSGSSEVFNPHDYSVMFAHNSITLDPINNTYRLPVLIMDLNSRKQVFDDPSVVFGYRLEAKYERKQENKCYGDLSELSADDRDDCLISDKEEFVTIANPFGTIYGKGDPTIDLALNEGAVARLTPGKYEAVLTAIFNNGNRSSARVHFTKTSLSGDYSGRMSVYVDFFEDENGVQNVLANSNVSLSLHVDTDAPPVEWDTLLKENNLYEEKIYDDITSGFPITGVIDGNENMLFNATSPIVTTNGEERDNNEIPVKGIYSPHLGRMRLVGVVEIDTNFCHAGANSCDLEDDTQLKAKNPFGRKIRRLLQLMGPFDPTTRLFHGNYRETISGLAPWDVTLDGGFRVTQVVSDTEEIDVGYKLLPDGSDAAVGFSSTEQLLDKVEDDIDAHCSSSEEMEARDHFTSKGAFDVYLSNETPIFAQTTSFKQLVGDALEALSNDGSYLTINEYYEGQIAFCEDDPSENCVSRGTLRCGLALHQKAVLSGWVDLGEVSGAEPYTLFCPNDTTAPPDCLGVSMAYEPTLATLREHNRFYEELIQTSVYQANNAISNAFYVLYKKANGDALGADSAFGYKGAALKEALALYDAATQQFFSGPETSVLYGWPMSEFAARGQSWIDYMQTIVRDRMQTTLELIDLKRRVMSDTDEGDLRLAHHLLHMEYLKQVFLITLQKHWQKEQFLYTGSGQELTEIGDTLLAKTSSARNPLGIHPGRVYFENSDKSLTNWQNYKNRVAGEMADVEQAVVGAVAHMKAALEGNDAFENALFHNQSVFEAELQEICGSDEPLPESCDISDSERERESLCVGDQCLFKFTCEPQDDECNTVAKAWEDATGESKLQETACRANGSNFKITVGGQERVCSRGHMGALLQEKILLEKQREKVITGISALMRQIDRQNQYLEETQSDNQELIDYLTAQGTELEIIEKNLLRADMAFELARIAADGMECFVIAGTSNGSDCPATLASAAVKATAASMRQSTELSNKAAMSAMLRKKEIVKEERNADAETRRLEMELDNMVTQVENYILEYESITQQLFNLDIRIRDLELKAKSLVKRNEEIIGNIVDRLIGRESGSVLVRNGMVQEADRKFHHLLVELYKMVMAFNHRYNMKNANQSIVNRVYQATTLEDVQEILDDIDAIASNYCGAQGLDCDWVHNPRVLKFSIREQLFPSLTDIVDAKTGRVLTKGQQFHNIITSSPYIQKRKSSFGDLQTQIEIPFSIWANDRGASNKSVQRSLLDRDKCNHIIVAEAEGGNAGTIAVNVIGSRLYSDVEYDLRRGDTDYVRSCDERDDRDQLLINTYIAGYAPQSAFGQMDQPPKFYDRMGVQSACINHTGFDDPNIEDPEACFKYFARDRSLAAPDWKLVVPYLDSTMGWILGDGLPVNQKPIIEDIVIYIRNSGRPI